VIVEIEHIQLAMPAEKEDDARHFYVELLGMTEVAKPPNLALRGGCWFENGAVKVHLGVQNAFIPAMKAHPAFVVSDLEYMRNRLNRAGVDCNDDEPLLGFIRTYINDPFGNRIELMERIEE